MEQQQQNRSFCVLFKIILAANKYYEHLSVAIYSW